MRLSTLLKDLLDIPTNQDLKITGLSLDSRTTKPGDLFFAYPGTHIDGRDFIGAAIEKGAGAVVAEEGRPAGRPYTHSHIFFISNLAAHVGHIAARFYGHPSHHMYVVGITGTNGKTSCSHFIAQALQMNKEVCGVIGTIGNGLYSKDSYKLEHSSLTTPDPISLQKLLAEWHQQKVKFVAMEAASHGLVQGRVNGVEFTTAVFTNLTRDHLDYHGDMANYAAAKRLLFSQPGLRHAVFNVDDEYGKKWAQELADTLSVFTYSLKIPPNPLFSKGGNKVLTPFEKGGRERERAGGFVYVGQTHFDEIGLKASVHTPWGDGVLHNPYLIGRFNLSNLLAVLTVLGIAGLPLQTILAYLAEVRPVPGRMQIVGGGKKPLAVIDYSHTPDALEQALTALREHCRGKLWCVFGCGGDRDRGKRPLMGKIAEQYADQIVITDDNPRHEDPRQIVSDIMQGLLASRKTVVEHDRRRAIAHALSCSQANDVVLIAGKGHESYQIIGDEKNTFSDAVEAQLILNEIG